MTDGPDIIAELAPSLEAQRAIGRLLAALAVVERDNPRWRLSRAIQTGDLWLWRGSKILPRRRAPARPAGARAAIGVRRS